MNARRLAVACCLAALAAPAAAQNCFDGDFGVSLGVGTADTVFPQQYIGFLLPFGGSTYSHVHVTDHGFVTLSNFGVPQPPASGAPELSAPTGANFVVGGPKLAPFYADIEATGGGECFVKASSTLCTVTWWNMRPRGLPNAPRFSFQLQMTPAGEIRFVYGPGVANQSAAGGVANQAIVGVTPGGIGSPPASLDLSLGGTSAASTTHQAFLTANTFDMASNTLRLQRAGSGFAYGLLGAPSGCAAAPSLGVGCDGLALGALGLPAVGNAGFALRASSVPAVSPLALFAFGTAVFNPGVPLGPLLGMTGCTSYSSADLGIFTGSPTTPAPAPLLATSTFGLAIPAAPSLLGTVLSAQALSFSLANPFGLAASNGVEIRIGQSSPPVFVAPNPSLIMLPIAPGSFQMGSNAGTALEQPVHTVTLTYPFWMSQYEVTQAQYQSLMGINPSYFQGVNAPSAALRPVEQVSWSSAAAYCRLLTEHERAAGRVPDGYQYRLPTEAEWEYCCRAGTTTEWHTGASLTTAQANIQGVRANATYPSGQTAPVGSYPPNPWGLHDMHGNVREWCLDTYAAYTAAAATDPYVTSGTTRVNRGGAWFSSYTPSLCRSAYRFQNSFGYTNYLLGFRVVLAPVLVVSDELNLVPIAAGSFQMGSVVGANEQPVHQVTLSRPFWMSRYEVTQAEFLALMGFNPSFFSAVLVVDWPTRPVEQTTKSQALAYCAALDALERAAGRVPAGYQYRLPTEAEWEYCCRAGTTTDWSTGATLTTAQANFGGALATASLLSGQSAIVGSYPANPWGLHDMHGNVWEWTLDKFAAYPAGSVVDPYVPTGSYPILRGGFWSSLGTSNGCRSAYRSTFSTAYLAGGAGFRYVLAPTLLP